MVIMGNIVEIAFASALTLGRSFTALSTTLGRPYSVDGRTLLTERAELASWRRLTSDASVGGASRLMRAGDGWVSLTLARPDDISSLPALFHQESTGFADDPWPNVRHLVQSRSAAEIVARATLLGLSSAQPQERSAHEADSTPFRRRSFGTSSLTKRPIVVDLSALWAGPVCANLLGRAGFQVVKVESVNRLDGARIGPANFYNLLNAGHDSVTLDFGDRADRAILRALCAKADVVVTASRQRALDELGLDPASMMRENPISAWVAISAFGPDEPDRIGFGDDAAVAGGLVATEPDGSLAYVGDAIADPLTGLTAAAAVLQSFVNRERTLIQIDLASVAAAATVEQPEQPEQRCIAFPRARPVTGQARPAGADNDTWVRRSAG